MNKSDILSAAQRYGSRFVTWLDFIVDVEAVIKKGMIIFQDEKDGQGLTICGLTQKSDGLDIAKFSPEWVASTYYNGKIPYWLPVANLPFPIAECLANYRLNMGLTGSTLLLQSVIRLPRDGILGPGTMAKTAAVQTPTVFCRELVAASDERYRAIVAKRPERAIFLKGWLRRNQRLLSRFVAHDQDVAQDPPVPEAMSAEDTPSVRLRSLQEIMDDLVIVPQVMT